MTGTGVWLYVVLRKGGISWQNWFHYLFLRESYLYFLTNLMLCFLIFYYVKKYFQIRHLVSIYFVIGLLIKGVFHINTFIVSTWLGIPLNSLLIFYLGIIAREYDVLNKFQKKLIEGSFGNKTKWSNWVKWGGIFVIFILIRWLELSKLISESLQIVINLSGVFTLLLIVYCISYWLAEKRILWVTQLGKYSFPLYLLHMPAAGVVARLLNQSEMFAILTIWRPYIVIMITMGLIKGYEKINIL